ncbi:MAG TPA: sulfite reductase subunit alpha [Patescibacteria group bacterium]|jgi:sulfite reductase (NADPH) flavoprotein alpha-component|nr:sulfite reductase subunit alpha [Patescibacteria group bacterium]
MRQVPVIPENAPFDAAQRLWLNGFLAGLFARTDAGDGPASAAVTEVAKPLVVIYGTQTGTAEGLARRLATQANSCGFQSRVVDASAALQLDWSKQANLLIVISTYGDGDVPDNAKAFWDWLQTDAAMALAHLHYSVLALGDSNYEHFCAAGKRVDARLEAIGARRASPRVDCDIDYETAAKSWMENALTALAGRGDLGGSFDAKQGSILSSAKPKLVAEGYSRTNPFPARLLANRQLTGEGSAKEVRHIEICLEGSGLGYEPGDALGVRPTNCPALVRELLDLLQCDGEEAVPIPGGRELSFRKALGEFYDITKPSQELLKAAAEAVPDLAGLLEPNPKEELKRWLLGREVIDVLVEAPRLRPAPNEFVGVLKALAPRLYSISSSLKVHPGQVHLTVGIVRHDTHGRARKGVCSTFLADRALESLSVPVFVQPSPGFRLPASGDTPIIMVGPGTGVAPFRAFLQERQAAGAKGRNWLFFGEQRAESDFFYRDEFVPMLQSGLLNKLSTAFSRDQANKVYVQHRMLEEAAMVWEWLQEGAHFYVCGDAQRMAKDVEAALHRVIELAGGRSPDAAREYVNQMRTDKRYQRDVY